ncbi:MAG: hypothetical protein ABW034_20160 [Steroidobacteraceae bacterium]
MDTRISHSGERRRMRFHWLLLLLCALQLAVLSSPLQAKEEEPSWIIAPYVWGPDVKGDVGISNVSVPMNVGLSELGSGVKLGAMGYVRWTHERTFLYAEGLGLDFKDKSFAAFFNQSVRSKVVLAEAGVGRHYRRDVTFPAKGTLQLSPYVGGRYTWLNVEASNPLQTLEADDNWVDLAVGVMAEAPLYGRLSYVMKADAAGFGLSRDRYWNVIAGVQYPFTPSFVGIAAYRISRFDADQGGGNDLDLNLRAAGPLLGLAYQF